jgi:hypothetical protein
MKSGIPGFARFIQATSLDYPDHVGQRTTCASGDNTAPFDSPSFTPTSCSRVLHPWAFFERAPQITEAPLDEAALSTSSAQP